MFGLSGIPHTVVDEVLSRNQLVCGYPLPKSAECTVVQRLVFITGSMQGILVSEIKLAFLKDLVKGLIKASLHCTIIPQPQVLALDVQVVTFVIERILIVILRTSESRVAIACVFCAPGDFPTVYPYIASYLIFRIFLNNSELFTTTIHSFSLARDTPWKNNL